MSLQYISDSSGKTTGVFIPINEWDVLKTRYEGIEQNEFNVPEWHKEIVRERIAFLRNNPGDVLDFDSALKELEKEP